MMSPELRARWSAALREPGRVQGYGQLCTITPDGVRKQCCLDVLIELYQGDHPEGDPERLIVHTDDTYDGYGGVKLTGVSYGTPDRPDAREAELLPGPVATWAGLDNVSPAIGSDSATYLNDSRRRTFAEIADEIDDPGNTVF